MPKWEDRVVKVFKCRYYILPFSMFRKYNTESMLRWRSTQQDRLTAWTITVKEREVARLTGYDKGREFVIIEYLSLCSIYDARTRRSFAAAGQLYQVVDNEQNSYWSFKIARYETGPERPVFPVPLLRGGAMGKSDGWGMIIHIAKRLNTPLTPLKRGCIVNDRYTYALLADWQWYSFSRHDGSQGWAL